MKQITVVSSHPKPDCPGVFVVFFSNGSVMDYNSKTDCWLTRSTTTKQLWE